MSCCGSDPVQQRCGADTQTTSLLRDSVSHCPKDLIILGSLGVGLEFVKATMSIALVIMSLKEAVTGSGIAPLNPLRAQLCHGQHWCCSKALLNFFFFF